MSAHGAATTEPGASQCNSRLGVRYDAAAAPHDSLRALGRSLRLAFTALLRALASEPSAEAVDRQLGEVRVLVTNVQHCLNSLRPQRAREDLLLLLRAQLQRKQRALAAVRAACADARGVLSRREDAGCAEPVEGDTPSGRAPRGWVRAASLASELEAARSRAGLETLAFPVPPAGPDEVEVNSARGPAHWWGSDVDDLCRVQRLLEAVPAE